MLARLSELLSSALSSLHADRTKLQTQWLAQFGQQQGMLLSRWLKTAERKLESRIGPVLGFVTQGFQKASSKEQSLNHIGLLVVI